MSVHERATYAAAQARLLEALLRGDGYPEGVSIAQADAAAVALRRKRARAVAHAWPALALDLGAAFASHFDDYARDVDPPRTGGQLRDGLAFVRFLGGATRLGDDARAERLLARGALRRRWPLAGATWLRRPRLRLFILVRLPLVGLRGVSLRCPVDRARRS